MVLIQIFVSLIAVKSNNVSYHQSNSTFYKKQQDLIFFSFFFSVK